MPRFALLIGPQMAVREQSANDSFERYVQTEIENNS